MSETNWTPGSWGFDDDGFQLCFFNKDKDGFPNRVVLEDCIAGHGDEAESIANAHLIAAAPELYEALKRAADRLAEIGATVPSDVTHALAKARGEV